MKNRANETAFVIGSELRDTKNYRYRDPCLSFARRFPTGPQLSHMPLLIKLSVSTCHLAVSALGRSLLTGVPNHLTLYSKRNALRTRFLR